MFTGAHTAIVTPFRQNQLDEVALKKVIDHQFNQGITGIVPVGTTGESPTLDTEEHLRVIERAVEFAAKRGLVIAGTGSNSTAEAIELTQGAQSLGVDASLQVAPYYNKPTQKGLILHFQEIAKNTDLPIILYSIPGRCGIEIAVDTVVTLAETCPNIIAIKEAGGSVERVNQLKAALPESFEILSGDDSLTLPFISAGATGVISVAGNLIPGVMERLVRQAVEGDFKGAMELHRRYYPLFSAFMKLAVNPLPIKTAMHLAGFLDLEFRLPLAPMEPHETDSLASTLRELGLIS